MMHLVSLSDAMSTCWSSTDVFLAADFVFQKVKLQQHMYCMKLMLYYCFRLGLGAHSPIGLLGHRDGPLRPCRAPISISNSCFTKQSPERLRTLMGMTLRVIHLSPALARSPPQHLSLPFRMMVTQHKTPPRNPLPRTTAYHRLHHYLIPCSRPCYHHHQPLLQPRHCSHSLVKGETMQRVPRRIFDARSMEMPNKQLQG